MPEAVPENLLRVAQVLKPNGADGALVVGFRDYAPECLDTEEPVFICYDGLPVPFFVTSFTPKGSSKALIRLEGIDNSEDVEEIVGQPVYMDADLFEEEDKEDLAGWTLLDKDGHKVGEISNLEDIPGNPCLYVETKGREILIPFHEDFVLFTDPDKREITMNLPEGLL